MSQAADERFALKATNVAQPQLEHYDSRQSITATEDYLSAEQGSRSGSPGSDNEPVDVGRFSTPPEGRSPEPRTEGSFFSSTQAAGRRIQGEQGDTIGARFSDSQVRRKAVGSPPSPPRQSMISSPSPPTPGDDDTPYIRFAIDQLTRDEEVRGSRKYGPAVGSDTGFERGPYDPRISTPTPEDEVARHLGEGAYAVASPPYEFTLPPLQAPVRTFIATKEPNTSPPQPDVFIPFDPPVDSLAYPALNFVPGILRPLQLGVYIFLCTIMLALLLVCGIYPLKHDGLYNYVEFGGSRYFLFQYLPATFGMVLLLWLLQIQIALQRITPFMSMASWSARLRSDGPLLEVYPTSFIVPKVFYFRAGQPIIGTAMLIFWLFLWTIPLLSCLFNVHFYGQPSAGAWRWVTVQGIVWTVIVLYILLILILVFLLFWLRRQRTGLKWDPRSLADLITLINQSNIGSDYNGSETFHRASDFRHRLSRRSDRLGYWQTSRRPNNVFYGIGEEGAPTRLYSIEAGKIREKAHVERSSFPDTPSTYAPPGSLIATDLESGEIDEIQHRYLPWYLRPSFVLLWCVGLLVLYLAFLIASFVKGGVIHGFVPLVPVAPDSAGFGATNFLYSFVPAVLAQLFFLSWLTIDYSFRQTEPYAALSTQTSPTETSEYPGAPASDSLLLDYPCRLPVSVSLAAATSAHYRIAWFSFLSLIAACIPVLAGGCFWAQWYVPSQQVRVAAHPPGYYTLCVFLALIVFSIPLALPRLRHRGLPHRAKSLAEHLSWLYASAAVVGRGWAGVGGGRAEMVTRLLEGDEHRFAFGEFVSPDGLRHLGVFRVGLQDQTMSTGFNDGGYGGGRPTTATAPVAAAAAGPATAFGPTTALGAAARSTAPALHSNPPNRALATEKEQIQQAEQQPDQTQLRHASGVRVDSGGRVVMAQPANSAYPHLGAPSPAQPLALQTGRPEGVYTGPFVRPLRVGPGPGTMVGRAKTSSSEYGDEDEDVLMQEAGMKEMV